METPLYYAARAMVGLVGRMPLTWVARVGRVCGWLAFYVDRSHRRVALENLQRVFGKLKTGAEIHAIALENFCRIGETYFSALRTSHMTPEEATRCCEIVGIEKLIPKLGAPVLENRVLAIGHFGNFELYTLIASALRGYQGVTTYRGLAQPSLNRVLQHTRNRSGCLFFERRTDAAKLKATLNRDGIILGLLADQHAGSGGLRLPFLGTECSTSAAPAVFALRYGCPLFSAVVYRVGLGRWKIEVGSEIPTQINGVPRPSSEIVLDMNRRFEEAVLRDPANWFWVHKRWKPRSQPLPERLDPLAQTIDPLAN